MTTKEEALEIVKKHIISSSLEYHVLIEDLIIEDETIFIFILEQPKYLKYGKWVIYFGPIPYIIFNYNRGKIIDFNDFYQHFGTIEESYAIYKKRQGISVAEEQVNQIFKPLYEYRIDRKTSIYGLFYFLRRGLRYLLRPRDIHNYINHEKLLITVKIQELIQIRDSFQGRYFQGFLYALGFKK